LILQVVKFQFIECRQHRGITPKLTDAAQEKYNNLVNRIPSLMQRVAKKSKKENMQS